MVPSLLSEVHATDRAYSLAGEYMGERNQQGMSIREQAEALLDKPAPKASEPTPSNPRDDEAKTEFAPRSHRGRYIGAVSVAVVVALVGYDVRANESSGLSQFKEYAKTGVETGANATIGVFQSVMGLFESGADNSDSNGALSPQEKEQSLDNPSVSPSPTDLPPTMQECIAEMPVRYKLAQNMFVPVDFDASYYTNPKTSVNATFEVLDKENIGNVIVMGDPSKDPNKTIKQFSDPKIFEDPLVVANDQEGGIVKRLSNGMPSQEEVSKTMTAAEAEKALEKYYTSLKESGINMAFGPVLDISREDKKPSTIGQARIFTGSPENVAAFANSYIAAAKKANVSPVGKHFPGGGSMGKNTDTSNGIAYIPDRKTLESRDLKVWSATADALDHAMLSTAAVQATDKADPNSSWTEGQPAVFSKEIYDAAAAEYGIDGMITTDDLGTRSIVDKDGKPQILPTSFVEVWKNGGTPLFVQDLRNVDAGDVLTLEKRLKTILDAGEAAVEAGEIDEATLNRMMEVHLAILNRDSEACDILERLENEDDTLAKPVVAVKASASATPSPTPSPSPSPSTKPSAAPTATPKKPSSKPTPTPTKSK